MQEPRIEVLPYKKLVGKRIKMKIADNQTFALWRSFMPRRNEIKNIVGNDLFSLQEYDPVADFSGFNINTEFEKWAAVEVSAFDDLPEGMEVYNLEGGLYAVFLYKGLPSAFDDMFRFIFHTWLPSSGYLLDNTRAHFEVLGEKYKRDDPSSEEDIWIPIKKK